MFPFLPFLTLPECKPRPKRDQTNIATTNKAADTSADEYILTYHIPTALRIEIRKSQQLAHAENSVNITNKKLTSSDSIPANYNDNNLLTAFDSVQKPHNKIGTNELGNESHFPSLEAKKMDVIPKIENKLPLAFIQPIQSKVETDLLYSEVEKGVPITDSSETICDDLWPKPSTKSRFNADFNMSMDMSFAIGNETVDEEEQEHINIKSENFQILAKEPGVVLSISNSMDVDQTTADEFNTLSSLEKKPNSQDFDKQENVGSVSTVLTKESVKTDIEELGNNSALRCSSFASTSSAITPSQVTSKQHDIRSPSPVGSSSSKSPRTQLSTIPINTPPNVRAARARQRAFQPSQAMLDLFSAPVEEPSILLTKEKKAEDRKKAMILSEPGPELIEPDEPDVIVSTPDDEQGTLKSSKSKRNIRGRNGVCIGAEVGQEDRSALTKMQLSDPGPEMASESDEVDEISGNGELNEYVKNDEDEICLKSGHSEKNQKVDNNKHDMASAENDVTKLEENEDSSFKSWWQSQTTINSSDNEIDEKEEIEMEIVVEYDAFGRRFEREVRKLKEKNRKGGRKALHTTQRRVITTKQKMHEDADERCYDSAGQRLQQYARVGATRSMHDNKNNNNQVSTVAAAIQHSTFTQRTNGGGQNDSNKTMHINDNNINAWNAENYRHSGGRQIRKQQGQQRSAVADILKESTDNMRRKGGRTSETAVISAGSYYSEKLAGSSLLQNLGDKSTHKIPSSSPKIATRANACDRTTPRQGTKTFSFNSGANSSSTTRITGDGVGDTAAMLNGGNDDDASISATGNGGAAEHIILIRNANVINEDEIFFGDILIEDGIITKIAVGISEPTNAEVIEANGYWILPAGIDVHTQFSQESTVSSALASGTKAALLGGTTTIVEIVCARSGESLAAAVDRIRRVADANAKCNYGMSVVVNGTWNEQIRGQMTEVVCERGVNSFLLDFSTDAGLIEALSHARQIGAQCCLLPDNAPITNFLHKCNRAHDAALLKLEAERAQRFCVFSQLTNAPIVLLCAHINTKINDALHAGRADGAQVNAEIPLKALACEYGNIERKSETDHALELLANGALSMIVSNDMSELWTAQKSQTPASINSSPLCGTLAAMENRLSLLWEHGVIGAARLDPMRFVAVTSSNPAKTFNMFPKKGRVSVGSDADLVLWNFETSRKLESSTVHCAPTMVICNGEIVVRDGRLVNIDTNVKGKAVGPRFVSLPSHSPYLFPIVDLKEKTFNLAQLSTSISARKNTRPAVDIVTSTADASRRTSLASSCISAATTSDALAGNERKPSGASVGHHLPNEANRLITTGTKNRNIQSTNPPKRSATKVIQPPGGPSTRFW